MSEKSKKDGRAAGKRWPDDEIKALVHIWRDPHVQQQIRNSGTKKKVIYDAISAELHNCGFPARLEKEIKNKIKILKKQYKQAHSQLQRSGAGTDVLKICPLFYELATILGDKPDINPPAGTVGESYQREGNLILFPELLYYYDDDDDDATAEYSRHFHTAARLEFKSCLRTYG